MAMRRNWKSDAGVALIVTPAILLCVPIWAALNDPSVVVRDWQIFLPFVLLPMIVGISLYVTGRRAA